MSTQTIILYTDLFNNSIMKAIKYACAITIDNLRITSTRLPKSFIITKTQKTLHPDNTIIDKKKTKWQRIGRQHLSTILISSSAFYSNWRRKSKCKIKIDCWCNMTYIDIAPHQLQSA